MPVGFSKPEIVQSLDVTDNIQIPKVIFELPNQHPDYTQVPTANSDVMVTVTRPTLPKTVQISPSAFAKAFEPSPPQFKSKEHNDVAQLFKTRDPVADQISSTTKIFEAQSTQQPTQAPYTSTTTLSTTTSTTTTERPSNHIIDQTGQMRTNNNVIPEPIDGLLPPHTYFRTYDDSTTEGPPIYYQWKWAVPAFVLEPPNLNDPLVPPKGKRRKDNPFKFLCNPFFVFQMINSQQRDPSMINPPEMQMSLSSLTPISSRSRSSTLSTTLWS